MARSPRSLVVLHGHGDDPGSVRPWAAEVLPVGWTLVVPEAPRGAGGERTWFESGPRGADDETLQRSVAAVGAVIDAEVARGREVVVAGFSQGAALALCMGSRPGLVGAVGFCAFLPETPLLDLADGPPALVLGAVDDEVVPPFLAEDSAAAMGAAGRAATADVLPGSHEVSAAAISRAAAWLEQNWPSRIRVSLQLPTDRVHGGAEFLSLAAVAEVAAGFEAAGADAAYVTDHPAPDQRWLDGGGHHALEPTVALTAAAAGTTSLLLHTHVYVLGYRNPFLAAKALASLDVLSGGRLVLGVAAGYLKAEFNALGAEFDERGRRLDEALELLPRIWTESGVAAASLNWTARGVTALPRPLQRPHPPVWIGGNSPGAMRRAVRVGQGWSPFPTAGGLARATRTSAIDDLADLAAALGRMEELCGEADRLDMPTVCFAPFGDRPLAEEVGAFESLGVDWLTLTVPGQTRAEVIDRGAALVQEVRAAGRGAVS